MKTLLSKIGCYSTTGILLILLATVMVSSSCNSRKSIPTLPDAHPESWMDEMSADFHGRVALQNGNTSCAECHGADFDGGRVEVSCRECHEERTAPCLGCHGGADNQTGAPPMGLRGEMSDSALAVGAHTAHLRDSELANSVGCDACHLVPLFVLDPLHWDTIFADGRVVTDSIPEITWGGIANSGGASWDRTSRSCSSVYCHGAFAGGISTNVPIWTEQNQAECGSCHDISADPESLGWKHGFHVGVAGLSCGECHSSMIDTLDKITNPALHVNGLVDTLTRDTALCASCHGSGTTGSCTVCHGGVDNQSGAPPKGLHGETSKSSLSVGAHTNHLDGSDVSDGVLCSECHVVPLSYSTPGHMDADSIAELSWGALAGPLSSWNRSAQTCEQTYCHGNFVGGDVVNTPVWTGENQASCGSCHDVGADPVKLGWKHEFHVTDAGLDCADCHTPIVDAGLNITDLARHVDGIIDTTTRDIALCNNCHGPQPASCNHCHGGIDNQTGAPPKGLRGELNTNQRAVGAHTMHLEGGSQADAFACTECHTVPDSLSSAGHYAVDSIADMTWGALAGPNSAWDRNTETCGQTYCHGNFSGGDQTNSPSWTGSNQADCGSCHDVGSDPASLGWKHGVHVADAGLDCADCHTPVVDAALNITDLARHVDGIVDTTTRDVALCNSCHGPQPASCNYCHGGVDNQSGAPPKGLHGEQNSNQLAVGAHTMHLEGGVLADAFDCSECHVVPDSINSPGHYATDSLAEITWGLLAGSQGVWNRNAKTCGQTYCHGDFAGGDASNTPIWTAIYQATCGSCHDVGADPDLLGGEHKKHVRSENVGCNECHSITVDGAQSIIGQQFHVNGQAEVSFSSGNGTFSNNECSNTGCHGTKSW